MNIKTELLINDIAELLCRRIDEIADADEIANTKAIKMLDTIQEIIMNAGLSDFLKVEEIVYLFEKNRVSTGSCHECYY